MRLGRILLGRYNAGMKTKEGKELIKVFMEAGKSETLMEAFLEDILTPAELEEVVQRWQIVKMLAKGERQHAIAKKLGIGVGTVTRGSKELKDKNGGFTQVLKKFKF